MKIQKKQNKNKNETNTEDNREIGKFMKKFLESYIIKLNGEEYIKDGENFRKNYQDDVIKFLSQNFTRYEDHHVITTNNGV